MNIITEQDFEKRREELIIKPLLEKARPLNHAFHELERYGYDGDRIAKDYGGEKTAVNYGEYEGLPEEE